MSLRPGRIWVATMVTFAVSTGHALAAQTPFAFESNGGRFDAGVRFVAQDGGATVALDRRGARVGLAEGGRVGLRLAGADPRAVVGDGVRQGLVHDLRAGARKTGLHAFSHVRYVRAWRGIDVLFHGDRGELEYDLVVAPGADARRARIDVSGGMPWIAPDGSLRVRTHAGTLVQRPPVAYQDVAGRRVAVDVRYALWGRTVSFILGKYDRSRELIIDPVVVYQTYLGSTGEDDADGLAVDGDGNVYVLATTTTPDWLDTPTQTYGGVRDLVITKLNPTGTARLWATYWGGGPTYSGGSPTSPTNGHDIGGGIALDAIPPSIENPGVTHYRPVIVGSTDNLDFPGAPATVPTGTNAFVSVLNETGDGVVRTRLIGGDGDEMANAVAVGEDRVIHVVGTTTSEAAAFNVDSSQPVRRGPTDAFVARINTSGAFTHLSLHGGTSTETGMAVAASGTDTLVAGETGSADLPGFSLAVADNTLNGATDGYVTRVAAGGSRRSTYFGGVAGDGIEDIARDGASLWITGTTSSTDIATPGAAITTAPGDGDAFAAHLASDLSARHWSTYLGASHPDLGLGIAHDPASGDVWVAGQQGAVDSFNTTVRRGRAWRLSGDGSTLKAAVDVGSDGNIDEASHAAMDPRGGFVWVAGTVDGYAGGQATPGALQPDNRGGRDLFLARLDADPPETTITKGPEGEVQAATVTFEFSTDDPAATFACALDGTALGACTSPFQVDVDPGGHVFSVVATDDAGNTDLTPAERAFTATVAPAATPTATATATPEPAATAPPAAGPSLVDPFSAVLRSVAGVLPGEPVLLDAGDSQGTPPLRYSWDLDGDGSFEVPAGAEATRPHSFLRSGRYSVGVRVRDAAGRIQDARATVEVVKRMVLKPEYSVKGRKVNFKLNPSTAPGFPVHHYVYDFGDGSEPKTDRVSKKGMLFRGIDVGKDPTPSHRYDKPGLYRWSFTAIAENGQALSVSGSVAITGGGVTLKSLFGGGRNGSVPGDKGMYVSSDAGVTASGDPNANENEPTVFSLENVPKLEGTTEIDKQNVHEFSIGLGDALWDMGDKSDIKKGLEVVHAYAAKFATKEVKVPAKPGRGKSAPTPGGSPALPIDTAYHGQVTYSLGAGLENQAVVPFTVKPVSPVCHMIKIAEDAEAHPQQGTCFFNAGDGLYRTAPGASLFVNGIEIRPISADERVWFSTSGSIGRDIHDRLSIFVDGNPIVETTAFSIPEPGPGVREIPALTKKASSFLKFQGQVLTGSTFRITGKGTSTADLHLAMPAPFGKETLTVSIPLKGAPTAKAAVHDLVGLDKEYVLPEVSFGPVRAYDVTLQLDKRHWLLGGGNLEIFKNLILAPHVPPGADEVVNVSPGRQQREAGPLGFAICDQCPDDASGQSAGLAYAGAVFEPKNPIPLGPVGLNRIKVGVKTDPFWLRGELRGQVPTDGVAILNVNGCVQLEELKKDDTTMQCAGDAHTVDQCIQFGKSRTQFLAENIGVDYPDRQLFFDRFDNQENALLRSGMAAKDVTTEVVCRSLERTSDYDQFWLRVQADVTLKKLITLGGGYMEYRTGGGGSVHAGGYVSYSKGGLGIFGQVEADFYLEPFRWQVFANVDAYIFGVSAGAQVLLNNKLIAACIDADLYLTSVSVGGGYEWGGSPFALGGFDQCDLKSDYGITATAGMAGAKDMLNGRARPMATTSVVRKLPKNEPLPPALVIRAEGTGQMPRIKVTAPDKTTVYTDTGPAPDVNGDGTPDGLVGGPDAKYRFIHFPEARVVALAVPKPQAGDYTVEAIDGTSLVNVSIAKSYPKLGITGNVRKLKGGNYVIDTFVPKSKDDGKLEVTIVEDSRTESELDLRPAPNGGAVLPPIGAIQPQELKRPQLSAVVVDEVVEGEQTYKFSPAFGPKGKREIYAQVTRNGVPLDRIRLDSYIAPAPDPIAAPEKTKVTRKGDDLKVDWETVRGAVQYLVTVARTDGVVRTVTMRPTRARSSAKKKKGADKEDGKRRQGSTSPLDDVEKGLASKYTFGHIPESVGVTASVISADAFERESKAEPAKSDAVQAAPPSFGGFATSNPAPTKGVKPTVAGGGGGG